MFRIIIFSLLLTLWGFEKVAAAVALPAPAVVYTDSVQENNIVLKSTTPALVNTNRLHQKWQHFLLNKMAKKVNPFAIDKKSKKDKLSTIALILGLSALVILFITPINFLTIFLAPAAIVTGFIAKHNNPDKKSRTKAWIGIAAAMVPVLLVLFLLLFFSVFNFE